MISRDELHAYILDLDNTWVDYPFGPELAVYKYGPKDDDENKMFALIQEKSDPLRLSVKCDPQLAVILRDKYETVLPGQNLNKKLWNTIICTGQVADDELHSFIVHAYQLVKEQS